MANEKPNCKKCRYRIHLANLTDIHIWGEDCDKYGTDICKKMNDPEFIKWRKGKTMTEQQAIDWCEQFRDNIISTGVRKEKYTLALKAMRIAITAISKRIPQKLDKMACPSCGRIILMLHGQTRGANYCDMCGQAWDWGNNNG